MYPTPMNLTCVHCSNVNEDVWVDGNANTGGFRCKHCNGRNVIVTRFNVVAPDTLTEDRSPMWHSAIELLSFRGIGDDIPFFSEAILYDLIGKDDARSVLGYLRRLLAAGGITMRDVPRTGEL